MQLFHVVPIIKPNRPRFRSALLGWSKYRTANIPAIFCLPASVGNERSVWYHKNNIEMHLQSFLSINTTILSKYQQPQHNNNGINSNGNINSNINNKTATTVIIIRIMSFPSFQQLIDDL